MGEGGREGKEGGREESPTHSCSLFPCGAVLGTNPSCLCGLTAQRCHLRIWEMSCPLWNSDVTLNSIQGWGPGFLFFWFLLLHCVKGKLLVWFQCALVPPSLSLIFILTSIATKQRPGRINHVALLPVKFYVYFPFVSNHTDFFPLVYSIFKAKSKQLLRKK